MPLTEDELEHMTGHQWRGSVPPLCPQCGYNLTGLGRPRCPECGTVFSWREILRNTQRIFFDQSRLKHANQDAAAGLRFVGAAWLGFPVAWFLGLFITPILGVLLLLAVIGTALVALVLGMQVFRAWRVPAQIRDELGDPPNVGLGVGVTFLALGLLGLIAVFAIL